MVVDALGRSFAPYGGEPRIVSLVPSLTELVVDLGLAARLVGRTGFCVHPRDVVRHLPKVGGTKDVKLDVLRRLAPTHVIVNVDENRREQVEAMREFVPHVIVTHPLRPEDNEAVYRLLGVVFGVEEAARALTLQLHDALRELRAAAGGLPRERVLYLIWKDPWMTVSRDTYISAMLATAGWDTVPDASVTRYPRIALDEDTLRGVARVLLSSEPYRFREPHRAELAALPCMAGRRVELIDGEQVSWYGSRAICGLRHLARLRRAKSG